MDTKKSLKAFIALARTFHYATSITKEDIKEYGLSTSEFATMELLFHKGPQPIQEIGKRVLLTSGSMTYVVNQLEQKGHVRRSVCAKDKRVIYAELTNKGSELIQSIFPKHASCIRGIFDSLTSSEIEELTKLLNKVERREEQNGKER